MNSEFFECKSSENTITVFGGLNLRHLHVVCAKIFQITRRAGYGDVVLDLSDLTSINPSVMPPLIGYIVYLRQEYNVFFELLHPKHIGTKARLRNYGFNYYAEAKLDTKPRSKSSEPMLIQFENHDEQEQAVDRVLNSILRTTNLDRDKVKAVEWALNEITDNVLTHSHSKVGGFIIYSRVPRTNIVEFTVADSGIGIPRSLGIVNEEEAVEKAIQEGVTRNKSTNQGNGLFGTFRLAQASSGIFALKSRHGLLFVNRSGEVRVRNENVPYVGTYLVCQIDCDRPELVTRALIFDNLVHNPAFDYLEKKHENFGDDRVSIDANSICSTFGSRKSGLEARQYVVNMLNSYSGKKIWIDFQNVNIISSSYADELFGKLFVELGPMRFMRFIMPVNTCSEVEVLIDRAISKRSQTGL